MTDLSQYQPDHLFLLIGKNPLPNYVAAKLLIKERAKVYFVYSEGESEEEGTEPYKERLVKKLQERLGKEFFTPCGVPLSDPSNATCIEKAIRNQFKCIPKEKSVGLHYTGGTKAMSIHTYRNIEEIGNEKSCKLTFSYLDPRSLKLCFDKKNAFELGNPTNHKDLFDRSKISLEDLLYLHGLKLFREPQKDVRYEEIVYALFEEKELKKKETTDCTSKNELTNSVRELLEEAKQKYGYSKSEPPTSSRYKKYHTFLREKILPLPDDMPQLKTALQKYDLLSEDGKQIILSKIDQEELLRDFCKILALSSSRLFEYFVLAKVKKAGVVCFLHDCCLNLDVRQLSNQQQVFFEIDVVAMRGYQLFAISCTLDTGNAEKNKLFEIAHRAKQLGGDEARISLVCRAKTVSTLEEQLNQDNIRVFGLDDLDKLEDRLKDWFEGK